MNGVRKLNFSRVAPGSLIVRINYPKALGVGKYQLSLGLTKRRPGATKRGPDRRRSCVVVENDIVLMIAIVDADARMFNFFALSADGCGWGEIANTWNTWSDA